MNFELQKEVDPWLRLLKYRFQNKIEPEDYYLCYSGGKDSHFLYWFIKEWLREPRIEIVGVNTSFEIPEIRNRIIRNSDTVLHPVMNRWEIKKQFGIPCYSKQHDEYIYRYQHGSRSQNTMKYIMGENPVLNLNKKARELLLAGNLHRISNKCCLYNKEKPLDQYGRAAHKKPIMGVRQSESRLRKAAYQTCLKKDGSFAPIYNFTDDLIDTIYKAYDIPVPSCYMYTNRTGCAGCPYGRNVETELALLPDLQRQKAIEYFKESYDAKGIEYRNLQMVMRIDQ